MTLYEIAASAVFAVVVVGMCTLGERINEPTIIWLVVFPICLLITWTMVQPDAFAGFAKPIIRAIGVRAAAALFNVSGMLTQYTSGSMLRLWQRTRQWPQLKGNVKAVSRRITRPGRGPDRRASGVPKL